MITQGGGKYCCIVVKNRDPRRYRGGGDRAMNGPIPNRNQTIAAMIPVQQTRMSNDRKLMILPGTVSREANKKESIPMH